jgi:hypothetical protein
VTAFLVVLWMTAAAAGGGLAVLRMLDLLHVFTQFERIIVGFIIGTGIIGWAVFFPGVAGFFESTVFVVILTVLTGGLIFMRHPVQPGTAALPFSIIEWAIIAGIAAVALLSLTEALSPAADADTMAYHFETPRRFLAAGIIYGIPRAIDGVTQLLLQMTYGVALGLGGKAAPPLWSAVSSWGFGALFFLVGRRHMRRDWALAGTLCLMSTPAVIYGAGTGQVEVRVASFALLGAYAAALSLKHDPGSRQQLAWVVLAGIAAGYFAGSKMTGLLFAFATCVTLAIGSGAILRISVFSLATAITGIQWYIFNWAETGDPLYPMLWQYLDLSPAYPWNDGVAASFKHLWDMETPLPRSIGWFLTYPARTIIAPLDNFESLRTGLGPAVLLLLPFAVVAFLTSKTAPRSPLVCLLVLALLFYALWFFLGPSLRIRHLLPIYPLVFLCVLAGAARLLENRQSTKRVLCAGFAVLLAVQLTGKAVFSKKFIDYLQSDATQSEFLANNISGYAVVDWINRHLTAADQVMVTNREWLYLLDVPYFFAHPSYQTIISLYDGTEDVGKFIRELSARGITHVAIPKYDTSSTSMSSQIRLMNKLHLKGCALQVADIQSTSISSRTLSQLRSHETSFLVFRLHLDKCR